MLHPHLDGERLREGVAAELGPERGDQLVGELAVGRHGLAEDGLGQLLVEVLAQGQEAQMTGRGLAGAWPGSRPPRSLTSEPCTSATAEA